LCLRHSRLGTFLAIYDSAVQPRGVDG
jgi:hypothetical protein